METYTANDQWTTETYMIPGTGSNLNLTPAPPIREIDTMGNEVVPEFIADQGLYYPAAANYYGYYCTGLDSPSEWNDHHRFFGTDGQDLQSPGLQTDGLQYVYYSPSYGYAQSPYNPYNPFIPGATVVAPDGPFLGMQQYMPSPAYHQPVSSPAYFPVVVQPGLDGIPTVAPDPSLVNGGALVASAPETAVVRYMFPTTSVDTTSSVPREASQAAMFHSMSKLSEGPQTHVSSIKPAASQGITAPASSQQISQGRNGSGSLQTFDNFSQGNGSSGTAPSKVNAPSYYGLSGFGSNVRGWSTGDKLHSRYTFTGGLNNGNGNPDMLGEQNRGPRTSKPRSQSTASIVVKAYTSKAGCADEQGNIRINIDQYNWGNFPVNYPSAKFFVIKSYSEDDVHKSIKYNVWSSTPNGNKRLDVAFEDAQRISGGNKSFCPVFLFFSVNASGQFCGVAEMTGPVDFHKDMDFWQQDKWSGSFPVKWHIVKDVPNTSFRHIILENNENKPVTNSRDTQEILYIPGLNMLSIFKDSPMRTSVLDDFIYYEDRQRIMHEEKSRLLGRNHASSIPIAASVLPGKVSVTIKAPPKAPPKQDEKPAGSSVVASIDDIKAPSKRDEKPTGSNSAVNVGNNKAPIKQDEKRIESNNVASTGNHVSSDDDQITSETTNAGAANGKKDASSNPAHDSNAMAVLKEIELLSIGNSSDGSGNHSAALATTSSQLDVFTVGSMPVKVNGFGESSEILTIGTISIDPKAVLQNSYCCSH